MKKAVVFGAGGFIGGHLVKRLKAEGYWVRGVDLKHHEFMGSDADHFIIDDLRDPNVVKASLEPGVDEVYQLAADMGGSTYINVGENDADVMHNSCLINLNTLKYATANKVGRVFYASSACVYPEFNQLDPDNPKCSEDTVYPAEPDSEYGWEKLFGERMFFAFAKQYDLKVKVARYHNIYGPYGTWDGGREKAPAALCRKIAMAKNGDEIEVYGDGLQTRSFLFVDQCIEGTLRLMRSPDFHGPVNIGSEELISLNDFAKMIIKISGKDLTIKNTPFHGVGVRGRNSDNKFIKEKLDWAPDFPLSEGIGITYDWIQKQVEEYCR